MTRFGIRTVQCSSLLFFCVSRYDCGSGMGLVRTKNQVLVGAWNHLRVRRHDWKGFVQLNDGPETGTLSKVVTFKLFHWCETQELCCRSSLHVYAIFMLRIIALLLWAEPTGCIVLHRLAVFIRVLWCFCQRVHANLFILTGGTSCFLFPLFIEI